MAKTEINNKAKSPVEESGVEKVVSDAIGFLLEKEKIKEDDEIELSIAFVGKQEIGQLNAQYRKKDEPTDVLSFSYGEGLNGEIVLCYDIIEENSREDGVDIEAELNKNIIHGMLHILGYEHGEEMFMLQDSFVSET